MKHLQQLENLFLEPSSQLVTDIKKIEGDIMVLGAGGKMGPGLAKLAVRAINKAGIKKRVIAVSRFSDASIRNNLENDGVEIIPADLLNETELAALPQVPNILYLAGTKFGTTGKEPFTWAMNAYLPGRVASRFSYSRIVAFSTGNVYPLSNIQDGGSIEKDAPMPIGEYGQSCLGRERVFQYFSALNNQPLLIYRLNYAVDFKYGVVVEIARSVMEGKPIDLSTGNVNVIWQGDANEIAIRSLLHCSAPAKILNVTGPETVSIRWMANQFAKRFGKEPVFMNQPNDTALLSNAAESFRLFGYPKVSLTKIMELVATWLEGGGLLINKPTHFQERNGKY
jgi:nucleoside-diphosphate-sugar epimerase